MKKMLIHKCGKTCIEGEMRLLEGEEDLRKMEKDVRWIAGKKP